MEARVGIEPTHKGFADLSLTAWVPRHLEHCTAGPDGCRFGDCIFQTISPIRSLIGHKAATWSGRRDLNPRPSPWQGDALPLSYSRIRPEAVYRAAYRPVNAALRLTLHVRFHCRQHRIGAGRGVDFQLRLGNGLEVLLDAAIKGGITILCGVGGVDAAQALFGQGV